MVAMINDRWKPISGFPVSLNGRLTKLSNRIDNVGVKFIKSFGRVVDFLNIYKI